MSFPKRFNSRPRLVVSWKRNVANKTVLSIAERQLSFITIHLHAPLCSLRLALSEP